jgi:hypothetical protein
VVRPIKLLDREGNLIHNNRAVKIDIAKIATLKQAALVSGIPTTTLIEHLREVTILCDRD